MQVNMPGLGGLKIEVHTEHEPRLRAIEDEDYSGIVRKVRDIFTEQHGLSPSDEFVASGLEGLKQYYAVALLDPLNAHAASPKIDMFWHAHMLHSRQYAEFCDRVVSRFMHHEPLNDENEEEVEAVRRLYDFTLEVLDKMFVRVDPKNFPARGEADYRLLCSHNRPCNSRINGLALFPFDPRGVPLSN